MEATKITKIEFDNPVVIHEGEQLVVQFANTPDELMCKCVLVQKDGKVVPVGEDVEDVVDDPVRDSGPVPDESGEADPNSPAP